MAWLKVARWEGLLHLLDGRQRAGRHFEFLSSAPRTNEHLAYTPARHHYSRVVTTPPLKGEKEREKGKRRERERKRKYVLSHPRVLAVHGLALSSGCLDHQHVQGMPSVLLVAELTLYRGGVSEQVHPPDHH